ncbi:hypothetical protein WJX72_011577 [[Myrmecia] bisecta]|uniref:Amine oxidase domain-containing protein n=1 Tax=[Myrmecia] bisecta TaxID=41462 RepID=A0AAW1QH08_9CHLO
MTPVKSTSLRAWSLSRYPDKFSVEVWEAGDKPGGVASTVLDLGNGLWVNEQVQGGFQHSYANTLLLLKKLDIKPQATWPGVRLSVGNATLHHEYWDNFSDQASFPVLERHATETARFLELLRSMMQGWRQALGVLPIGWLLRMLRFSNEFQRDILYPLLVTLNGTGNQMARTPSAVVANILMHPIMRVLGPGSQARLLAPHSQGPQHFIFSNLQQAYAQLAERIAREPGCSVHCSTPVSSMSYCKAKGGPRWRLVSEAAHREGVFDKVIFTCGPEATLKLLATSALPDSWLYRFVFNRFEVYDVSIITHTDEPYIRRHYGLDPSRPEELPLWMVRWVRQRAGSPGQGLPQAELSYALSIAYKHWNLTDQLVFQTNIVQDPGIDPSKVLSKRTARHVAMTFGSLIVPSLTMGRLQDRHGALFAGAYMMGNPHEAATHASM